MNAEKMIMSKISLIENTIVSIRTIADIFSNVEDISKEEMIKILNENMPNRFDYSSMVEEWFDYARITYLRLQICKNKDYTSIAVLNATIFLHNFIEKFFI